MRQQQPAQPAESPLEFRRLSEDMHEHVHLIATHMEITSLHGPMALDVQQAQQTAHCLRATAEAADRAAHAYNSICDFAEAQHEAIEELDEIHERMMWRFKAVAIGWAVSIIAAAAMLFVR